MSIVEWVIARPRSFDLTVPGRIRSSVRDETKPVTADRLPFLDFLRAVSAHVIVWHHLMLYGPLADAVAPLTPNLSRFLLDHGRNAVQVFLVIGGFLTAQTLAKRTDFPLNDVWTLVRRRYLRIAGPYLCVLLFAILANWLAERWMEDESISAIPTLPQVVAHAVFLQDLLGYEALSAGVWYLAIDFQLGLIAVALWWCSLRLAKRCGLRAVVLTQGMVWLLAAMSLAWFNRNPEWDAVALFFFGSYAFGMITSWALSHTAPRWSFWAYTGLMALALVLEFRPRLAVALATGLLIFGTAGGGWLMRFPKNRIIQFAGASSYSLFLIHFPVCLVVNAWLSTAVASSPWLGAAGMFGAYALSVLASTAFYFGIEQRFASMRP